jgi:hypothetical protein
MSYKVGDICRVNEQYGFNTEEREVIGSIVQIVRIKASRFTPHLLPEIRSKILFGTFQYTDQAYVFYENELDLITGEPSND